MGGELPSPSTLWASDALDVWAAALARYDEQRASLDHPDLDSVDAWFFDELCPRCTASPGEGMTHGDLIELMRWKLTRGKRRPRLLAFVTALDTETAETVLKEGIRLCAEGKELRPAVNKLIELRGVGPATASAILTAADPTVAFMSDEALQTARGSRDYTLTALMQFQELMRAKAESCGLCSRDVERALWASHAAHGTQVSRPPKKPAGRKGSGKAAGKARGAAPKGARPRASGDAPADEGASPKRRRRQAAQ